MHPGAVEVCDGVDEDCNLSVDDHTSDGTLAWPDTDGDGWGSGAGATRVCALTSGWSAGPGDCDDARTDVHPGAVERCDAARADEDCDGLADDADPDVTGGRVWHADADGDGLGDPAVAVTRCVAAAGEVGNALDCGDLDATVGGATVWHEDADGDGAGAAAPGALACDPPAGEVASGGDCDDADADVHPGAPEVCDGRDDDCDGLVDDADPDRAAAPLWYTDGDGDGYGSGTPAAACEPPSGAVANGADCEDAASDVHPFATETCDGRDEDCDGGVDEDAEDAGRWFTDADGDGYGAGAPVRACSQPTGGVATAGDCNDDDASAHPGAAETAGDGIDQDCDGADAPGDTADDVLPDSGDAAADSGKPSRTGCGCAASPRSVPSVAGLLALAFALRRRRTR